jgi:hypothetical protein
MPALSTSESKSALSRGSALRSRFGFAVIGSTLLTLLGLAGIAITLAWQGIGPSQFFSCIPWYAGFGESSPRFPAVAVVYAFNIEEGQAFTRPFDCAAIDCPLGEFGKIAKSHLGGEWFRLQHEDPFAGRDAEDHDAMQRELTRVYWEHIAKSGADLHGQRQAIAGPPVTLETLMQGARGEKPTGDELERQWKDGHFGDTIVLFGIDSRGTAPLFYLIWSTALGILGAMVSLAFRLRRPRPSAGL